MIKGSNNIPIDAVIINNELNIRKHPKMFYNV